MKEKILLVDDNPNILSFLQPALENEGYGVITAVDGLEALHLAERAHPDLIILDIEIPEPSGLAGEIVENLRAALEQFNSIYEELEEE